MLGLPLVGGCFSLALFNGFIDPFGLRRWVAMPGINAIKIAESDHRRLIKAYRVRQVEPKGLILGTSVSEGGVDPQHPGWPARARPVYNASIPYANAYELLRYFQHAVSCGDVAVAVVGLDFVSFNAYLKNSPDFSEARLAMDVRGRRTRPPWDEELSMLLSLDASRMSWRTLRGQNNAKPFLRQDGMQTGRMSDADTATPMRDRFLLMEHEYIHFMWRHGPDRTFALVDERTGRSYAGALQAMLEQANRSGVQLHLVFSPLHARLMIAIDRLGWWPEFEEWKRMVARLVDQANLTRPEGPGIDLWDFADFNELTTESVPGPGSTALMENYYDAAHYTRAAGNRILDKVFRTATSETLELVAPSNVEQHLQAVASRKKTYELSHTEDVAEIADLVRMRPGDDMHGRIQDLLAKRGL
ncbi:MAG: hypothetical protein V1929_05140 [bacterium]